MNLKPGDVYLCYGPTSEPFAHKYGGAACNMVEINLKPHFLFNSNFKCYMPDWWGSMAHRRDEGGRFVVPEHDALWESFLPLFEQGYSPELEKQYSDALASHPNKLYLYEIAHALESLTSALCVMNNLPYSHFRVIGEIREAYVHVLFVHGFQTKEGCLIWKNSD